jgi:hypothetical protein
MSDLFDLNERGCFNQCAKALQNGFLQDDWHVQLKAIDSPNDFQKAVIRFHEACTRAMSNDHRFGGEPDKQTLDALAKKHRFPQVVARALCRELKGDHRDQVLASSVTQAALVLEDGEGQVMDLTLELIEDGSGEIYPAPEMLFVETDPDFCDAITQAFRWIKGKELLPDTCDVRWRLKTQSSNHIWPDRITGDSAGGAFLFALVQLVTEAKPDQGGEVGKLLKDLNRHQQSLRGVMWMCTVSRSGDLEKIGAEIDKLLSVREKSLPRIHTVVAAQDQKKKIEGLLKPEATVDGIQFVFETDPIEAAKQVVALLDGKWEGIFDYRQDLSKHRDAIPRPWLETILSNYETGRRDGAAPGYLVMDAPSGFGKSAAAAQRFDRGSPVVAGHFFREDSGRDDPEDAIRSVVLQLCQICRFTAPNLASKKLKKAAADIFTQAGQHAKKDQRIQWVVLDGLDRCSDFHKLDDLLPKVAPEGLAFFVTTHPWMKLRDSWMALVSKGGGRIDLPAPDRLKEEISSFLEGRRRHFLPELESAEIQAIVDRSQGLIGVARAIIEHGSFVQWRNNPMSLPDGPGAWQGTIWSEGSPWQAIEDFRRNLIESTSSMRPLGFNQPLPIREAYIPMTAAPPSSTDTMLQGLTEMEGRERKEPVPFLGMFQHLERHFPCSRRALLLVGEPGSGKTTASQQLAWLLARREAVPGLPPDMLPVWLRFQEMDNGRPKPRNLEEFLEHRAEALSGCKGTGKVLLDSRSPRLWILDGFDEIPTEGRQKAVARWIRDWLDSPKRSQDFLLLTSRPLGTEKWGHLGLNSLLSFELSPLDVGARSGFIRSYFEQFNRLHPDGFKHSDVQSALNGLMGTIREKEAHSTEERRMARNPMLLSLISYLFAGGQLPDDWDKLYERFLTEFFDRGIHRLKEEGSDYGRWKPSKFKNDIALDILKQVAWSLQEQADRTSQSISKSRGRASGLEEVVRAAISKLQSRDLDAVPKTPHEFLRLMREHFGVMCWRGGKAGRMGFLHLNLQEWLAAAYCAENNQAKCLAERFAAKPEDQREVVRLAAKIGMDRAHEDFHHNLFRGLLSEKVAADVEHDGFLSHLLEMAGVDG